MEITANAIQFVPVGANVQFTDTVIKGNCAITHRNGSGLVNIKSDPTRCKAQYRITFGGNIAIPTGGTVGPISLAIAINGEQVSTTNMIVTPAAVEEYNHVNGSFVLTIPCGCCQTVSVKNTSTTLINVQNATLNIEKVGCC